MRKYLECLCICNNICNCNDNSNCNCNYSMDSNLFWEALYVGTIPILYSNIHNSKFINYIRSFKIPFFIINTQDEFNSATYNHILYKNTIEFFSRMFVMLPHLRVQFYN